MQGSKQFKQVMKSKLAEIIIRSFIKHHERNPNLTLLERSLLLVYGRGRELDVYDEIVDRLSHIHLKPQWYGGSSFNYEELYKMGFVNFPDYVEIDGADGG